MTENLRPFISTYENYDDEPNLFLDGFTLDIFGKSYFHRKKTTPQSHVKIYM